MFIHTLYDFFKKVVQKTVFFADFSKKIDLVVDIKHKLMYHYIVKGYIFMFTGAIAVRSAQREKRFDRNGCKRCRRHADLQRLTSEYSALSRYAFQAFGKIGSLRRCHRQALQRTEKAFWQKHTRSVVLLLRRSVRCFKRLAGLFASSAHSLYQSFF